MPEKPTSPPTPQPQRADKAGAPKFERAFVRVSLAPSQELMRLLAEGGRIVPKQ